jgi:hypothetical protein
MTDTITTGAAVVGAAAVAQAAPSEEAAGFDLGSLNTTAASNKGFKLELVHPTTKKPLGVFITVLGKDSDTFTAHIKEQVDERNRKEFIAQRRGKPLEPTTAAQSEENNVDLLVLCTLAWETVVQKAVAGTETTPPVGAITKPTVTINKQEFAFTIANVKRVYMENLWIRRQVDEAIGDLENFI